MAFSHLIFALAAAGCQNIFSFRLKRASVKGKGESQALGPGDGKRGTWSQSPSFQPSNVIPLVARDLQRVEKRSGTIKHKPTVLSLPRMKIEDFPQKDAFKAWRKTNGSAMLYTFSDEDTQNDPCKTDCSACPASSSAGFDPASLAEGGWPCLCHASYRAAVKAGDYKTPFAHTDLPYEFLLAGAFGQSAHVKLTVYIYLLKCIRLVTQSQEAYYDWGSREIHTAESIEVHMMGSNKERAATLEVVKNISRSIPWGSSFEEQLQELAKLDLSIDFVFSCLYKLLPKIYEVFNLIAKGVKSFKTVSDVVDRRVFTMKKNYIDFFCKEDTGEDGPCGFHVDVQMEKALHEEHDFSQPFDGWFEWRFISKRDGSGPPQKGPFTPSFKDALPLVDRSRTTLNVYTAIGLPFTEKNGELQKMHSLLKQTYGDRWDDNSVLPMGSGITWWEQFDCDCSLETCSPPAEKQICEGGFNRVAGRMGGRSVAGPSGTTQKMMQVARLLKMSPESLYLLRAGLIAWMVPAEDHSHLEILMGAEGSGLPYPHDSRAYSLSALLPGVELEQARIEVGYYLKRLHDRFGLGFSVEGGPRDLCALGKPAKSL